MDSFFHSSCQPVIPYSYNGNSQIAQTSGEVIDQAMVILARNQFLWAVVLTVPSNVRLLAAWRPDFDYVCDEGDKAFETYTGFCVKGSSPKGAKRLRIKPTTSGAASEWLTKS